MSGNASIDAKAPPLASAGGAHLWVAMARARMLADDPNLTFLELG